MLGNSFLPGLSPMREKKDFKMGHTNCMKMNTVTTQIIAITGATVLLNPVYCQKIETTVTLSCQKGREMGTPLSVYCSGLKRTFCSLLLSAEPNWGYIVSLPHKLALNTQPKRYLQDLGLRVWQFPCKAENMHSAHKKRRLSFRWVPER